MSVMKYALYYVCVLCCGFVYDFRRFVFIFNMYLSGVCACSDFQMVKQI